MHSVIKKSLRETYKQLKLQFIAKDKDLTAMRLRQQLSKAIDLINFQREMPIKLIGSYLCDESREICPPHLNQYAHAFPRFQKVKKGNLVPVMEFKLIDRIEQAQQKIYGIRVPSRNLPSVDPHVVLVPLTCFSASSKHRIGYGGGYYDRFIQHTRANHKKIVFIGIGAQCLKSDEQFWTQHDQPLDYIITQSRMY